MKAVSKSAIKVLEEIKNHTTFCVIGHIRPDGDCLGSQLALTMALRSQGAKVTCWNQDPVPAKLKFMDPEGMFQQPTSRKQFDCVIAVDAASREQLGEVTEHIGDRSVLINIDHHPSNTRYGDLNWISSCASSTGEMIFQLIKAARWTLSPEIADCLFTAISTDTGSFQYPSTSPDTFETAGELVKRGADIARISDEVYQSYSLSRVRLLKRVYNQFKLTEDNRIAYLWLKKTDYSKSGASREDTEGLIDHIRAIEPVEVACLFEELEPGETRISLRSKHPLVNVNEIAKQFGGGGHKAASGARVAGKPMTVQRRVIASIRASLKCITTHHTL
ncbi:MAG: bifunctional oligoribonuclease/PAP phosphatase NrnA [Verrucomicrobiota bacterium]|nr:bifunctional oligoribonuclease/PAP phosphatase NrnA [Verrucomicrobiota bacterium]